MIRRAFIEILLAVALVITAAVFSAGTACAHDPAFRAPLEAQLIRLSSDPAKSWAFYGRLAHDQEDHYAVLARTSTRVPLSLLLDVRDAANPARAIASVYDNDGAVVQRITFSHPATFYEPFSRVHYVITGERDILFAPGRSTVVIAMRGGSDATLCVRDRTRGTVQRSRIPCVAGAIYRIHTRKF